MSPAPRIPRAEPRHRANVRCPACRYALTGLLPGHGGTVRCPECGRSCDVERLRMHRREIATFPALTKLQCAAVILPVASILIAIGWLLDPPVGVVASPVLYLLGSVLAVGWGLLVASAVHERPDREAFALAALVQTQFLVNMTAAALLSTALIGLLVSVVFLGILERDVTLAVTVFAGCLVAGPVAYAGLRAAAHLDRLLACSFSKREMETLL